MINKMPFALIIFFIFLSCSPKSDEAVMERERKVTGRSSINSQIKKLCESLEDAKNDHDRALVCTDIASLYNEKGNVSASIDYSQKAVKYQPNLFMSHYLLGKAYNAAGRYDEAEKEMVLSITLKGDFAPSHFELGNAYYKKYNYNGAVSEYHATVRLDPKNHQAFNNLAAVLAAGFRFGEAESALKSAIQVKPDFAPAYKNLGVLYETRMKNYLLAIQNYRKYLELRPNSSDGNRVRSWIRVLGGVI